MKTRSPSPLNKVQHYNQK